MQISLFVIRLKEDFQIPKPFIFDLILSWFFSCLLRTTRILSEVRYSVIQLSRKVFLYQQFTFLNEMTAYKTKLPKFFKKY